ncbi:G-protein coupled receptor 83-like [Montipora foliosa]|uniref:G-protein coupled receptor 83-like n=1 Tax=Montipora foliosa TaxID=591990 RepID=UPI0035F21901
MSDTVNAGVIIVTVLYAITMLLSIVGNSSLIYIVWRVKQTRSFTSFMFVNMAVADLLITMIMMPSTIHKAFTADSGWAISGTFADVACKGSNYLAETTVMASILCLTFIAIDRFYIVNYPLKSRVAWFRKAKYITPFTWILSLALKSIVPVFFSFDDEYNRCGVGAVGGDFASLQAYFTYLFLVTYFLPLCVISILYGLTARTIWFRRTPGNRLTETKQLQEEMEKKRAVRMLVVIVAVFALCWLPVQLAAIGHIIYVVKGFSLSLPVNYLAAWFGHSNSAINPWLFICLSPKMKVPFWEMLGRGRRKNADRKIDSRKTTVNATHEEIPLTVSN